MRSRDAATAATLSSSSVSSLGGGPPRPRRAVALVVGALAGWRAPAVPMSDRLREEALPARADAERFVTVVEHDGGQQRGEVIVDHTGDESLAGASGDRLAIEVV